MELSRWTPKHTKEELNAAANAAAAGDRKASKLLAEMMRPYVVSFLRKQYNSGGDYSREEQDEVEQAAWIGVYEALERWDPSKGVKFNTYAMHWVRHEVYEWRAKNSRALPIPRRAWDYARKVEEGYKEKHGEDADIYTASDEELSSIEVTVVRDGREITRGLPYAGNLIRGRRASMSFDPELAPEGMKSLSAEEDYMNEHEHEDDKALHAADMIVSAAQEIPDDDERYYFVESQVSELGWPEEVVEMLLERAEL